MEYFGILDDCKRDSKWRSKSQTYERELKGKILEREGCVFRYLDSSQMDGTLNYREGLKGT